MVRREVDGKLYYVRYKVVGGNAPACWSLLLFETIMGDVAVCFNPDDRRYYHLRGKRVSSALVNREVPVIEDSRR